jgi:uncharacterized protein (DUF4415 family)
MNKKVKSESASAINPAWTKADFQRAQGANALLPKLFPPKIAKVLLKPRGRPKLERPKERINIRLSPDVLNHFKASGEGWQTRIDAALLEYISGRETA